MRRQNEENNIQKKATVEKERGQALEMRQRAMERIGETRKRQLQGNDDQEKKRRKRGESQGRHLNGYGKKQN